MKLGWGLMVPEQLLRNGAKRSSTEVMLIESGALARRLDPKREPFGLGECHLLTGIVRLRRGFTLSVLQLHFQTKAD